MTGEDYLQALERRLRAANYEVHPNPGGGLWLVARRDESYMGFPIAAALAVTRWGRLDRAGLVAQLDQGYVTAKSAGGTMGKPFVLLCVAVADDPDDDAVEEAEWGPSRELAGYTGEVAGAVIDARCRQAHYFQRASVISGGRVALRKLVYQYVLPVEGEVTAGAFRFG